MMRQFVPLALIGLALVPDWATALGGRRRRWCPPPFPPPCQPALGFVSPCLPTLPTPTLPVAPPNYSILPAPNVQVEPEPEPARPEPTKPEPARPEPGKADKSPAAPRPVAPGVPPGDGVKPTEFSRPKPAAPPEPRPAPKLDVSPPVPKTETPKTETPKTETPKLKVPQIPEATERSKSDEAKIPPLVPRLPMPDVPPLTIPQVPVESKGEDKGGTSTSKSSPLTGSPRVEIIPVDGPPPADPKARRTVGFFNHAGRDVRLTVEGETVTLPRQSYVAATVPAKFTWRFDGGKDRQTEIPAAAPGVEVVFRK